MLRYLLLALTFCAAGCQQNAIRPIFFVDGSVDAEALACRRAAALLESNYGGLEPCAAAESRMQRVAMTLARGAGAQPAEMWYFYLLASPRPNAFSLPGNRVYVTCGLYEQIGDDDALLAAALAHEMAHIQRRDSLKPACRDTRESLEREMAADAIGVSFLRRAGMPPESMARLLNLVAHAQPRGWAQQRIDSLSSVR